ncbi:MAG: hypothetical protein ABIB79_02820 [archaeon]
MNKKKLLQTPEFRTYLAWVKFISDGKVYPLKNLRKLERGVRDSWPLGYPDNIKNNYELLEWGWIREAANKKVHHLLNGGKKEDYFHNPSEKRYTVENQNRMRLQRLLEDTVKKYTSKTPMQKAAIKMSNFFLRFA